MSNEIENMEELEAATFSGVEDAVSTAKNKSPTVSKNSENPCAISTKSAGYITVVRSDASDSEASVSSEKSTENQSESSPGNGAGKKALGKGKETSAEPGKSWCYGMRGKKVSGVVRNAIKFEPPSNLDLEIYEALLTAWRAEIGPRVRRTLEDTCSTPTGLQRLKSSIRKFCQRRGVRTVWDRFIQLMTTETAVIDIIRNESKIVLKYVNRISGRLTREPNSWEGEEAKNVQEKVSAVWSAEELNVYATVLADWRVKLEPQLESEGLSNLCNRMEQSNRKQKRSKEICSSILKGEREIASLIRNEPEIVVLFSLSIFAGILHNLDGNEVCLRKRTGPPRELDESKLGSSYVRRKDSGIPAVRTRNNGTESLMAARKIGKARKLAFAKRKEATKSKKMRRSVLRCKEEANLVKFVRNLVQDGFTVPKTFVVGFVNRVLNNPKGVDLNWLEKLAKSNKIELKSTAEFEAIGRTMFG